MTSLTVELGLRRKRGNSPTIPDQLASRQDVTLAQKQRLAMLAKMGLGPAGGAGPPPSSRLPALDDAAESRLSSGASASSSTDRRRALLEKERRARELEELAFQEEEERLERERKAKQARPSLGIQKLGPVMARKEEIPQFLPSPAQVSAPPDAKLQVNISRATMERVKATSVPANGDAEGEDDLDDAMDDEEEDKSPGPPLDKKRAASPDEAQRQKAKKRKAKRPVREDEEKDERRRKEDEDWEDDEGSEDVEKKSGVPSLVPSGSQSNKRLMVVESVKGKVSNANRNFTDADLEKRFQNNERDHGGSLMTEEEALRMIRKEKNEKGAAGSAARRIQRDLAEWAATKELQRQRVKSPHRFERMVVSRK